MTEGTTFCFLCKYNTDNNLIIKTSCIRYCSSFSDSSIGKYHSVKNVLMIKFHDIHGCFLNLVYGFYGEEYQELLLRSRECNYLEEDVVYLIMTISNTLLWNWYSQCLSGISQWNMYLCRLSLRIRRKIISRCNTVYAHVYVGCT